METMSGDCDNIFHLFLFVCTAQFYLLKQGSDSAARQKKHSVSPNIAIAFAEGGCFASKRHDNVDRPRAAR
jgi:hypothetical protein